MKLTTNRLPGLLGKSQSYWHRRISGELPLDVEDLAALAWLLQVPVSRFFDAVVRREGIEPPTRCVRTCRPLVLAKVIPLRRPVPSYVPAIIPEIDPWEVAA
jgi:hypothetical protein